MGKGLKMGILFSCAFVLTACGDANSEGDKTTAASSEEIQEITIAINNELTSGDIAAITDTNTFTMINNTGEGLYRMDENNELTDGIAEGEPEISEDGLTYTFHLREDAKWSNGDDVVAQDFVYGWQRMVNPETVAGAAYMLEYVANASAIMAGEADVDSLGVKALDDHTLEVTLEQPVSYFLSVTTDPTYFPQNQAFIEEMGEKYGTSSETMISNGPFTLENWTGTNMEWTYAKNDSYWDADNVAIDEVNLTVLKDDSTAANLYESGEVDRVKLAGEYAKQYESHPDYQTVTLNTSFYLLMNQERDGATTPLANENLRKAIAYAIDREALTSVVTAAGTAPTSGLIPENFTETPITGEDFVEEVGELITYDTAAAAEFWEQAKAELGTDSLALEYLSDDDEASKQIAEFVQSQLQTNLPGLTITIRTVPSNARFEEQAKGNFDLVKAGWGPDFADPTTFHNLFAEDSPYNYSAYQSEEFNELLDEASTTNANDLEARWQNLLDAETVLMEEAGTAPLYSGAEAILQRDTIEGMTIDPLTGQQTYKYIEVTE